MLKKYFFLLLAFNFLFSKSYAQGDFSLISGRITDQLIERSNDLSLIKNIVGYLSQQQADGSWPDIDYTNTEITKWKPGQHLDRLQLLAVAFVKDGSLYFNNSAVWQALQNGLRYWYDKNPVSKNWWHNEIASPKTLGLILLLLQRSGKQLPGNLQQELLQRMTQGNVFEKTGANKLDIAIHMIYRACVAHNATLMDTAVQQAFEPIKFTNAEGIQYDTSYMQHGAQLQISSYGLVFLQGEYKVADWVKDTKYALQGGQLNILNAYLVHSFLPAIRGSFIDFNTEGRGISRKGMLDKQALASATDDDSFLQIAKSLSPKNGLYIANAINRINGTKPPAFNIVPKHKHFWNGDYTQHLREEYSFNVRLVSNRTKRTESGNKENLLGKFLPDGSTNIQRSGGEYYNIMPIWEWDKIPGITCRDFKTDQPITMQWGETGSTSFVGGVSDDVYGASAYDMDYDSVKAKKAWFFFDKEVVCLGAGISSTSTENITTTINQCWLNGKIKICANGKITDVKKNNESDNITWLWHDSIGYYFHQPAKVLVTAQIQKGSWSTINASQPKPEVEGDVFKLWLSHGGKPADSSYAYSVMPGVAVANMQLQQLAGTVIVSNTKEVQAVYHKTLNMFQAVFYKKGTVEVNEIKVTVDKACVLLIKNVKSTTPVIHIADPLQKEKEITVSIKTEEMKTERTVSVIMPEGKMAGSSCKVVL